MAENTSAVAPGWYTNPNNGDQTQYWDGNQWIDPVVEHQIRTEAMRRSKNKKLSTLGHLAWIFPVIGVLLVPLDLLGGVGSFFLAPACFGVGVLMWTAWLAVGAIVAELRKRIQ